MAFDRARFGGLADFRLALRRFLAASEAIRSDSGVTAQQYQVLLAIGCSEDPMTMKVLAEQMLLQSHAAVQLVNRLEKQQLVRRTRSQADGRSVILALTPAGEATLEALAARHLEAMLAQEPLLTKALDRLRRASAAPD